MEEKFISMPDLFDGWVKFLLKCDACPIRFKCYTLKDNHIIVKFSDVGRAV